MIHKKAFSLIELIFAIVVISIIASVALPKLMGTRTDAVVSTLKQDITTVITSIQGYYLTKGKIDKISDAVVLNSSTWEIGDKEIKYLEDGKTCVSLKITTGQIELIVNETTGNICKGLYDSGVLTTNYTLN